MAEADLVLMLRQQQTMMNDIATMRDDARVSAAILMRIDGTLAALVNEIRATHTQMNRMNERVRKLEESTPS